MGRGYTAMTRQDIAEAYYVYLYMWHRGESSPEHKRLTRLQTWFKPRHGLRVRTLSEPAQEVYDNLVFNGYKENRYGRHAK